MVNCFTVERRNRVAWMLIPLLLAASARAQVPARDSGAPTPAAGRIEAALQRAVKQAGGRSGVYALHLESGAAAGYRATQRFPMASTVKIPLAVTVLQAVDQGRLKLDQMVPVTPADIHPGSGELNELYVTPGISLSIRNLMELMLRISDNSATDILLRLAGGAAPVNETLRKLGIQGMRADRATVHLLADRAAASPLPPESEWTLELLERRFSSAKPAEQAAAVRRFDADERDTSTPEAMVLLLERIWRGNALSASSTNLLLDILRRCKTGEGRIKGLLPAGTEVAHKTGSLSATSNDAGIITLPDGAGHVAIAAFISGSERDAGQRDRAIAEMARAAYDYFLYSAPSPRARLAVDAMAARIAGALKPERGERVLFRYDPGYFAELVPAIRRLLTAAGAVEVAALEYPPVGEPVTAERQQAFASLLEGTDIYLWLPMRPGIRGIPAADRTALAAWLDQGGSRREIHFHWPEGSILSDGLATAHPARFDKLYEEALDMDYVELTAAQNRAVAKLRQGEVRIRTAAGTDLRFSVGDRPFNLQNGDASAARMRSAKVRVDREIELPAGVIRVAPVETTASGVLVIPEARFGDATCRGVRLRFERGELVGAEARDNQAALEAYLDAGGPAARRFREFGLGFHPKLAVRPGERLLPYYGYGAGVVRVSLGDNSELGGEVRGGFTRWLFLTDATVESGAGVLVEAGILRP